MLPRPACGRASRPTAVARAAQGYGLNTSNKLPRSDGERPAYTSPMGFDPRRAYEFSILRDRDAAPFFTGRGEEIRRFDQAIDELDVQPGEQAVFRIYQGAPGCGKTSLLQHLRDVRSDRLLFIGVRETHLASEAALVERVREVAVAEGPTGDRVAARLVQALGSRLRMPESGNQLRDAIATRAAGRSKVVLYMDEAQLVGPTEQPGLVLLHRDGLGVPTVCLFTGLSHTSDRFRSIPGLSRLGSNTVVNMGAMTAAECAASTRMLLDRCGAVGDRDRTAAIIAEMSHGWPQHLHGAQTALCHELLRTNGALDAVDSERLRSASDRNREEYYRDRLSGSVLGLRPSFTADVVARVRQHQPLDPLALVELCGEELARSGLANNPHVEATAETFAAALVERGVLSEAPSGGYDVAIPSMAAWLEGIATSRS